jgi:predicted AAA+ superfamily ATPase
MILTEKFFFFDVGVANYLAQRVPKVGSADFGKAFEHYVWMELTNYRRYRDPELELYFWRSASGLEVDFILGRMHGAVEVKAGRRVHDGDLSGMRALIAEHRVARAVVVCLEREPRRVGQIEILPWRMFLDRLWGGDLWQ